MSTLTTYSDLLTEYETRVRGLFPETEEEKAQEYHSRKVFLRRNETSLHLRMGYPNMNTIMVDFDLRPNSSAKDRHHIEGDQVYGIGTAHVSMTIPSGHGGSLEEIDEMLSIAKILSEDLLRLQVQGKTVFFQLMTLTEWEAGNLLRQAQKAASEQFALLNTNGVKVGKSLTVEVSESFGSKMTLEHSYSPKGEGKKRPVFQATVEESTITFTRTR